MVQVAVGEATLQGLACLCSSTGSEAVGKRTTSKGPLLLVSISQLTV